jgi:hypothetical protein
MIAIVCEDDSRSTADAITADLDEAYKGQLNIVTESASSPNRWPDDVNWDDLLIVPYTRPELPEAARDFISDFLQEHGEHSLVLPVSIARDVRQPPAPLAGIKAIQYDGEARGASGRIARRVGAMLGLKLRRRDNQILISYRAKDGTNIAAQNWRPRNEVGLSRVA